MLTIHETSRRRFCIAGYILDAGPDGRCTVTDSGGRVVLVGSRRECIRFVVNRQSRRPQAAPAPGPALPVVNPCWP